MSSEPDQQVRPGGLEQVALDEVEAVEDVEGRPGTFDIAHGNGPVHGHHRRRRDREKLIVERKDLAPVGPRERLGVGVDGVDGGLDLVRPGLVPAEASAHERVAFLDQRAVPR